MKSVFFRRCATVSLATMIAFSSSVLLAAETKEPDNHPAGHASGAGQQPTGAHKSKDNKTAAVKPTPKGENKESFEHSGTDAGKHK